MIKTLVYVPLFNTPPATGRNSNRREEPRKKAEMVVILLRGDHMVSDTKLATVLGTDTFRPVDAGGSPRAVGGAPRVARTGRT